MFPFRAMLQEDDYPLSSAKGRLCNNIDFEYDGIEDKKTYSTRPKLLIFAFLSFFFITLGYFLVSSLRYSKKFNKAWNSKMSILKKCNQCLI